MIARLLLIASLVGIVLTLPCRGAAEAAPYSVLACADAPSGEADAFSATNTSPATVSTTATCPPTPGASFSGVLASTILMAPNSPTGATASWAISAPLGTTLTTLAVRRYLGKRDVFWNVAVRKSGGAVIETCNFDPSTQLGCAIGSSTPTDAENYVTYGNLATQSVSFSLVCEAGGFSCLSGTAQRQAWIAVYGATATVEDPSPPEVGAMQGALVGTQGWHRGRQQATFEATDASGVRSAALLVDGAPVASSTYACDFTRMQPCPARAHPSFDVDLAQLADGPHELRARAVDAADQMQTTGPVTIMLDSHAPAAPTHLTAARNPDDTVAVRWTNPPSDAGAPVAAAHFQFCDEAGTACQPGNRVAGLNIAGLPAVAPPSEPAPAKSIRVWLEDEAGNVGASNATSAAVPPAGGSRPPGGRPPGSSKAAPRLRFRVALQRSSLLTIAGSLATDATGTISAVVRRGRARATAAARATNGIWKVRVTLPPAVRTKMRYSVVVRFSGDDRHHSAARSRRLVARSEWTPQRASRRFRILTA